MRADIADAEAVRAAVAGHDAVVHLAAKVDFSGPWSDYERINIDGTRHIIDACRLAGVARLVHVSSPSVAHAGRALVGRPGRARPTRVGARGPYARSKAVGEQLALRANSADLAVVAVRPHLVWGPGDQQLVARDRGPGAAAAAGAGRFGRRAGRQHLRHAMRSTRCWPPWIAVPPARAGRSWSATANPGRSPS